jgi:hypothetical protein
MTTEAVSAPMVPSRDAWRSLLWFAPLMALWILLIYRWPAIQASGVLTTSHQLAAHGLIALGLWLGLEHASLTRGQRRATWLAIMIPDTLWFAVAWSAAINGVFRPGTTPLPVLPSAIVLPVIIGAPLLLFSKRIGAPMSYESGNPQPVLRRIPGQRPSPSVFLATADDIRDAAAQWSLACHAPNPPQPCHWRAPVRAPIPLKLRANFRSWEWEVAVANHEPGNGDVPMRPSFIPSFFEIKELAGA